MKRFISIAVLFVLGAFVALSAGCAKKAEAPKPAAPQLVEVGAQVKGDLAKGCPEDLPMWEGATIQKSKHSHKMNEVYELELLINAPYEKVLYGYGKGFEKCGWNPQTVTQEKTNALISATKDTESAAITINDNQDKTTSVVVSLQMQ